MMPLLLEVVAALNPAARCTGEFRRQQMSENEYRRMTTGLLFADPYNDVHIIPCDSLSIQPIVNACAQKPIRAPVKAATMSHESDYVPISCADYEPLEIVCMDRYNIELTTHDGRTVAGTAVDLAVRPPEEFLVVRYDNGTTEDVRVDQIRYMAVLSRPCRFEDHTFATPNTR
jgi:Rho-binding antiterminator